MVPEFFLLLLKNESPGDHQHFLKPSKYPDLPLVLPGPLLLLQYSLFSP